jgi:hypothetical protein
MTLDGFVKFSKVAPEYDGPLVIRRASDIEPKPVRWLWADRIALGKQTVIAGEPGLGKSQLGTYLAAKVTRGAQWPNGEGSAPLGSVIILSSEDDVEDTIVPRLLAAGADCERVHIVSAVREDHGNGRRSFSMQRDLSSLENAIATIGDVKLIIIDTINSYLGRLDSHKNAEVRAVLEPIAEMASRLGVAIVSVTHLSKNSSGSANHRFIGSIAFLAVARGAYVVVQDPECKERRLFLQTKTNVGPPKSGLAFRIEERGVCEGVEAPAVTWDSEAVTRSADEVLAELVGAAAGLRSAKAERVEFLKAVLQHGSLPVTEVQNQARAAGLLDDNKFISDSKTVPRGSRHA